MESRIQESPFLPKSFVLCERSSGAVRFHVQAGPDGSVPVEKLAGLLAVHCLVRGQSPQDYELMVVPQVSLLDAAAERAQELLAAGRALGAGVKVSRREQEVLDGILQHLANKEIAARLNVSERTVKFHVSSLLAKFGVTDRVALGREATLGRIPEHNLSGLFPAGAFFGFQAPNPHIKQQQSAAKSAPEPPSESPQARARLVPILSRERFAT
jgi:DNA-binding CsgD family transcriptional regulator